MRADAAGESDAKLVAIRAHERGRGECAIVRAGVTPVLRFTTTFATVAAAVGGFGAARLEGRPPNVYVDYGTLILAPSDGAARKATVAHTTTRTDF